MTLAILDLGSQKSKLKTQTSKLKNSYQIRLNTHTKEEGRLPKSPSGSKGLFGSLSYAGLDFF